jgi:NADH:ubiquinone oxidoreductase subunit 6 (subunit J)
MENISENQIDQGATEQTHRVRRTFATILGGVGIIFLCLGLVSMVLIGFVSSPDAAKSTVKSALSSAEVRQVIADELVKKLEEGGDGEDAENSIVFSLARPLIVNAVANKLGEPAMRDFAGEVASKMYAVYIEDAPATTVDISTFATGTIDAIRAVDPTVPKDEDPKMDPIDVNKNEGDTDIKGIRNLAKSGVWLFLALGVLLQVAAWFLATAGQWKKLQRLGIRLAIGGVIMFATISVVKSKVPQSVEDNEAAAKAAANFITSPMLTRFIVLTVLGIVVAIAGFVVQRKENASTVS